MEQRVREDISFRGAMEVLAGVTAILAGGTFILGLNIVVLLAACGGFTTWIFTRRYGFGWKFLFK